jgi:hypothetical protein
MAGFDAGMTVNVARRGHKIKRPLRARIGQC